MIDFENNLIWTIVFSLIVLLINSRNKFNQVLAILTIKPVLLVLWIFLNGLSLSLFIRPYNIHLLIGYSAEIWITLVLVHLYFDVFRKSYLLWLLTAVEVTINTVWLWNSYFIPGAVGYYQYSLLLHFILGIIFLVAVVFPLKNYKSLANPKY
jgi:hypothetical protein